MKENCVCLNRKTAQDLQHKEGALGTKAKIPQMPKNY